MVPHITAILQRFTGEWAMLLQADPILTVCREIEYTAWRDRVLTPVTTMQLFLLQILHGSTARSHLPHLSGHCQLVAGQHEYLVGRHISPSLAILTRWWGGR